MKVIVDQERCEGHSRCMKLAPEVFEVRDDDKSHVLQEHPREAVRAKVEQAVRSCPMQAIQLED